MAKLASRNFNIFLDMYTLFIPHYHDEIVDSIFVESLKLIEVSMETSNRIHTPRGNLAVLLEWHPPPTRFWPLEEHLL